MRDGDPSLADRARFVDWLRASPENVAEYLELAELWEDLGSVGRDADVPQMLAEARNADNIVDLGPPLHPPSRVTPRSGKAGAWLAAAACALIVATSVLILLLQPQDEPITTTVGELRSITLADGSIIVLNTRTSIRYGLDGSARRVELIDGEALFDVGRDESRPFIVTAGATEVRVLGTSFNVYKKSDVEATVTVLEGRVAVRAPGLTGALAVAATDGSRAGEPAEVELTEGQQIHIQPNEPVVPVKQVPADRAAEWTARRITFENTALRDVVAQFNRYSASQLRVDDPELAALKLNGVFEPHSQEDLLEYLRQAEAVRVHGAGNERVISR